MSEWGSAHVSRMAGELDFFPWPVHSALNSLGRVITSLPVFSQCFGHVGFVATVINIVRLDVSHSRLASPP